MSSLQNILNPEDGRRKKVKLILKIPEAGPVSASDQPESPTATSIVSTEGAEFISDYSNKGHEPHSGCPDSLRCLPDTDGRPQYTLPVILRCAILGSLEKRLTIREIYAAMETKYSYYKTNGPTWKQSVRHHLSLNRLFERQPRPVTDPGFGSYWTVNLTAPPGTKRPRKRGRPNKEFSVDAQAPKKRGRPPKALNDSQMFTPHDDSNQSTLQGGPACVSGAPQARFIQCLDTRPEQEGAEAGYGSDEECESEDFLLHPMDRRDPIAGLNSFGSSRPQSFALPPFSSLQEGSDSLLEHLQVENESLRRQAAEAVSVSLRLSEQLVQAQVEASRAKATLRTIEGALEDESKRRKEAERAADDEGKKRQQAELALNELLRTGIHSGPTSNLI